MGVVLEFKRIGAAEPEELGGCDPAAGDARDRERASPSELDFWQPLGAVLAAVVGSGERDCRASAPRSATGGHVRRYER